MVKRDSFPPYFLEVVSTSDELKGVKNASQCSLILILAGLSFVASLVHLVGDVLG